MSTKYTVELSEEELAALAFAGTYAVSSGAFSTQEKANNLLRGRNKIVTVLDQIEKVSH